MTADTLLNRWLDTYVKDNTKAHTENRYREIVELHISPAFGSMNVSDIRRADVCSFIEEKKRAINQKTKRPLSSSSIKLIISVLRSVMEYARDMDWIKENPCLKIKCPCSGEKRVEAFTREEQRYIERYISRSTDRRFFGVTLCLYSGLRLGELLALEWGDIDMERGIITVTKTVYREKAKEGTWLLRVDKPKSRSSVRRIPLPIFVADKLREYAREAKSKYVVENKKGERMSIRSYQYLFENLTRLSGVRKLNFHALRHTFATRALECGMDVKTLSELMGHSQTSMTLNLYAHSMMDTKITMMNKLSNLAW